MGRTNKKKGSKGNRTSSSNKNIRKTENAASYPARGSAPPPYWPDAENFVAAAGPGCHMAHYDPSSQNDAADWVLGWECIEDEELDEEETPDLAIDPEDFTLSLYNTDPMEYKIAFITIYDHLVRGRNGQLLSPGSTSSSSNDSTLEQGSTDATSTNRPSAARQCTTLIVLCPPSMVCHLCHLPDTITVDCIDSDVQVWVPHPNPQDFHPRTISFPLSSTTPFLCTQGVGGSLTHFLRGNLHAIDFACPEGTPVVAVGNGTIVQVKTDCSHVTGIAVSNLFSWNSILLQLDDDDDDDDSIDSCKAERNAQQDEVEAKAMSNAAAIGNASPTGGPLFVEYVHIATATVAVGDRVLDGQAIGTSGGVGFSPEPHLHLAAYRSAEATAPTCGVRFHIADAPLSKFLPAAGQWYTAHGLVPSDG